MVCELNVFAIGNFCGSSRVTDINSDVDAATSLLNLTSRISMLMISKLVNRVLIEFSTKVAYFAKFNN